MKLKLGLMSLLAVGMLVGCGSGGEGSSKSSKSEKIDFSKYIFPEKSMKKKVIAEQKFKDSNGKAWGGSIENIVVKGNKVEYLEKDSSFAHSSFDIETNIIYAYYPSLSYYYQIYGDEIKRNIEIGDTIWTKGQTVCKLESQIDSLHHKYINFQGTIGDTITSTELSLEEKELYRNDILKVKCENGNSKKDITYYYFKKDLGRIATIQDNCYDENGVIQLDTTECSTSDYYYNFYVNDSYNKAMNEPNNRVVSNFKDIVLDRTTGLMWQDDESASTVKKQWLSDDNSEICYNNKKSPSCFNTSGNTANSYCSNMTLGGYTDWRLPTINELEGVVDINQNVEPFIKSDFLNVSLNIYWSSDSRPDSSDIALVKKFDGIDSTGNNQVGTFKGSDAYVRCVRYQGDFSDINYIRETRENLFIEPTETKAYFIRDNIKEIVTDTQHNWMWQDNKDARVNKKPWLIDENFTICTNNLNSSECYDTSGDTATTYCSDLELGGYDDWRLPIKEELLNQVTFQNKTIFKNRNTSYWSSETADYKASAHNVNPFAYNSYGISYKKDKKYVRCIREY